MNKDSYCIHDTTICYRNVTEKNPKTGWLGHEFHHFATFHRMLNMLRGEGFDIIPDKKVAKIIRKDYFRGRHGELEAIAHKYPNGFEITFFQNVNFENPNGGEYDFDKFKKMPYVTKLRYMKYMRKIVGFLNYMVDLEDDSRYSHKLAEDRIKENYVRSCHKPQTDMNFRLSDIDGQTTEMSYNGTDRDKKTIYNGEIKYFRGYDGRIRRGRVYQNLNMMWYVIINKYEYANVAAWELFDLAPDDYLGRQKKPKVPESYQKRRKAISDTKSKELINELKRRGIRRIC